MQTDAILRQFGRREKTN